MTTEWCKGRKRANTCLILLILGLTSPLVAAVKCGGGGLPQQLPDPFERTEARADCANFEQYRQPFFGDLHLHTTFSFDADLQGTRLDPDDAYAFARGTTVDLQPFAPGVDPEDASDDVPLRTLTIDRPLDFVMVSDHAEFFGEKGICTEEFECPGGGSNCGFCEKNPLHFNCLSFCDQNPAHQNCFCDDDPGHPYCGQFCGWYRQGAVLPVGFALGVTPPQRSDACEPGGQDCYLESATLWNETQLAADAAYDKAATCGFTSFVGYEWSLAPGGQNLHRNVVFRNGDVPAYPTSAFEAPNAESLWTALESDCVDNGPGGDRCQFLTIPHNSNLSGGTYFDTTGYDLAKAERRQLHEPLMEVMQHKGQSECTQISSPADELCDFEVLPFNTLKQAIQPPTAWVTGVPQDYARDALKEGMALEQNLGANPFKYGMVGGTDTHLGTPGAVAEDNYPGHGGAGDPAATELPPGLVDLAQFNPGGLTVIWAEENSRDSLYEAMRRREVYATSGTRPVVRFYGTFNAYPPNLCGLSNMVENADNLGPPMGGDLPVAPQGASPSFVVSALKDPVGTDLQRIQIIKGWVDSAGNTHEQVHHVKGDEQSGAGVFLNTCQPQGNGYSELCEVWTDPDFDATERAFYYARVIENPTCRWQQYQCNAGGVDCGNPATITEGFEACCDPNVPNTIQERAWTSPIWYTP